MARVKCVGMVAIFAIYATMSLGRLHAEEEKQVFEIMGIGGAGAMYTPMCSPFDKNFMLISCDMSGAYRSLDGGKTWHLIHWQGISNAKGCQAAFTSTTTYWNVAGTLKASTDKGKTWRKVYDGHGKWGKRNRILFIYPEEGDKVIFVGSKNGTFRTEDGGSRWQQVLGGELQSLVKVGGKYFAVASGGLQVSSDGKKWKFTKIVNGKVNGVAGGEKDGKNVIFAITDGQGIMKSIDLGATWTKSFAGPRFHYIKMAHNQTDIAYAAARGRNIGVCRTRDGGKTWENCFNPREILKNKNIQASWIQRRGWGFDFSEKGLGYCPTDPNIVMVTSQCDFYVSRDGGDSWVSGVNIEHKKDGKILYECNGFEVTSSWELVFDPNDDNCIYVGYADIGFARSRDRGKTWLNALPNNPWGNTTYSIALHPFKKGVFYAGASAMHDIPHWAYVNANKGHNERYNKGGVLLVEDYSRKCTPLRYCGFPEKPCTSVAVDTKNSTPDKIILYACAYGDGLYKSEDGGKSWQIKSNGLGNGSNRHVYKVKVDPKNGDVYCSYTAWKNGMKFAPPGGLWKSTDGGDNWTNLTTSLNLAWPGGFAIHPKDSNIIYFAAADAPGHPQSGVYKTTDGGKSWKKVVGMDTFGKIGGESFDHCFFVNIHPNRPDCVYVGTSNHGLWMSEDGGANWKNFKNIAFRQCHNVTVDPKNDDIIYVTTFGGGVWKGPYKPAEN